MSVEKFTEALVKIIDLAYDLAKELDLDNLTMRDILREASREFEE